MSKKYTRQKKKLLDEQEIIRTAIEKSELEGELKGKINTAKMAKAERLDISLISKITGLSEKEIEEL